MKIDRYSETILRELKSDGRLSNVELAHKIGLSPSATLRRVQELERSGVIKGYRAILDPGKQGIAFVAYVMVGLSDHSKGSQQQFEQRIDRANEVSECHNVTGSCEFLLRVETEDLAAYKRFHTDVLGEIPQVSSIVTLVVMDSPKDSR
ncbi:Lrp/AsnC family transcriptional regulator [Motiliproteus sediminis]|uniref:Lrp/AsnC family transcriptional regulator n=1 Tax=Motiliproteus sediminis TaxID=1468178 RepID=UPI001AEF3EF3